MNWKNYWKRIKKDCPKAWKLLCEDHNTLDVWGYIDNPEIWDMEGCDISQLELRHLFDFFDSHGIEIEIGSHLSKRITWSYLIPHWSTNDGKQIVVYDFSTRPTAELASYSKAFEILEQQL